MTTFQNTLRWSVAAASIAAVDALAKRVQLTAADLMARNPRTTAPDAPLESAARIMRDHKIGALPVLSAHALVGLITESDIFRAMVEVFETTTRAVRSFVDYLFEVAA